MRYSVVIKVDDYNEKRFSIKNRRFTIKNVQYYQEKERVMNFFRADGTRIFTIQIQDLRYIKALDEETDGSTSRET